MPIHACLSGCAKTAPSAQLQLTTLLKFRTKTTAAGTARHGNPRKMGILHTHNLFENSDFQYKRANSLLLMPDYYGVCLIFAYGSETLRISRYRIFLAKTTWDTTQGLKSRQRLILSRLPPPLSCPHPTPHPFSTPTFTIHYPIDVHSPLTPHPPLALLFQTSMRVGWTSEASSTEQSER